MSTGAGRVERAIRDYIEREGRRRAFYADSLFMAAFGGPPWTRSQRVSALRAMHRIVADQPGWRVRSPEGKRGVVFEFTPPADAPKSKRVATVHLMQRLVMAKPKSPRQRARERRKRLLAIERSRTLPYFWTAGRDTVTGGIAALLGLPRDCPVTTLPETVPGARSGIGCEAFDRVVTPPQTEEEALRALCLLDAIIIRAVSCEEVCWYQGKAGAIRFMFASVRSVREKAEIVHLMGDWWLGRNLAAVEDLRRSGSYSPPSHH
jgi:hypothetical protein